MTQKAPPKTKKCRSCNKRKKITEFYTRRLVCKACYKSRIDKAEVARRNRQHYKKRFFYFVHKSLKARAKASNMEDVATPLELWGLWKKQRGRCALTGRVLGRKNAHLDHILSVAKGGSHTIENLQWVTKKANLAKHTLDEDELLTLCRQILDHSEKTD